MELIVYVMLLMNLFVLVREICQAEVTVMSLLNVVAFLMMDLYFLS